MNKKLYEKNELLFAILWIVAYIVGFSVADQLSSLIGIEKIITALLGVGMSVFLFVWIKRNGLAEEYGLKKAEFNPKQYLFFIPLILIVSVNFWTGVELRYNVIEGILFVVSMLCVGFLEEIVFRGFLFKAMSRENITSAVIVSSVTFGVGHIINLLSGAAFLSTLLQVFYAIAIGFLFTIIFYKSGSLWPCIIAHGLTNALSVFSRAPSLSMEIITAIVLIVLPIVYTIWIIRTENKEKKEETNGES